MTRTYNNFLKTTLTRGVTSTGACNIYLDTLPTDSTGWLVISPSSTNKREIIYYTSKGSNYVVVSTTAGRGVGGTTAQTHNATAEVSMNVTAGMLNEFSGDLDGIKTGTKGDLLVNNGSDIAHLGVGADGSFLVSDSGETTGIKWLAVLPGSGANNNLGNLTPTSINESLKANLDNSLDLGSVLYNWKTLYVSGSIVIREVGGTNKITLVAPTSPNLTADYTLTLPTTIGTSGQPMLSNGSNGVEFGTLPIAGGGTGETTASGALNALLPSQAGNNGKILGTDGTNSSWVAGTANGSVTAKGVFEEATISEQGSHSSTGGSGARLVVSAANLVKASSGSADENRIAVLGSDGKYDAGFIPGEEIGGLTAGENLTAGDCIRLKHDGLAYKCSDVRDISIDNTYSRTGIYDCDNYVIKKVSDSKYLFIYYNGSTTYMKVGTIDVDGRWTFGTAKSLSASFNTCSAYYNASAITEDGTTLVLTGSSLKDVKITTYTISGTTLTLADAEYTLRTESYNVDSYGVAFVQETTNKYFVAKYHYTNGSSYYLKVSCGQVGSATSSTSITIDSNSSMDSGLIERNKEQQVVVVYSVGSTALKTVTVTQTANTKTLVKNSIVSIGTASSRWIIGYNSKLLKDRDNNLILAYLENVTSNYIMRVAKLSISGTTPSLGTSSIVYEGSASPLECSTNTSGNSYINLLKISNDNWSFVLSGGILMNEYMNGIKTDSSNQFGYVDISSTPIVKFEPFKFYGYKNRSYLMAYAGDEDSPFVSSYDYYNLYHDTNKYAFQLKIDPNNFIGWAKSSVSSGSLVNIDYISNDNQTGLTAGATYCLKDDGTLEQNGTGKPVCIAVSSTKVVKIFSNKY